ncbi:hypothetical protein EYF80_046739 [Liparis tanakae]|uniref:Uncharacterized protein n=1 Tax=Liparis tanakae TaxID=230148 RepID=A0A4Z2FQA8_9TELE|nr:hypothetical protein EYF80_046739 [Liparis tanakae]
METHRDSSRTIETHRDSSRPMETHRDSSRTMETHRDPWRLIENHGDPTRLNETQQNPTRLIEKHRDSSRLIESHRESSRLIETHRDPTRPNETHRDSSRNIMNYRDPLKPNKTLEQTSTLLHAERLPCFSRRVGAAVGNDPECTGGRRASTSCRLLTPLKAPRSGIIKEESHHDQGGRRSEGSRSHHATLEKHSSPELLLDRSSFTLLLDSHYPVVGI